MFLDQKHFPCTARRALFKAQFWWVYRGGFQPRQGTNPVAAGRIKDHSNHNSKPKGTTKGQVAMTVQGPTVPVPPSPPSAPSSGFRSPAQKGFIKCLTSSGVIEAHSHKRIGGAANGDVPSMPKNRCAQELIARHFSGYCGVFFFTELGYHGFGGCGAAIEAPQQICTWYGAVHGRAQEPPRGYTALFGLKTMSKNRPLVTRKRAQGWGVG